MKNILHSSQINSLEKIYQGKVRDIYEVDKNNILIISTDRVSVFDVVLPTPIPKKGIILNEVSNFWFNKFSDLVDNHISSLSVNDLKITDKEFDERLLDRDVLIDTIGDKTLEKLIKPHMGGYACHPFTYVKKDWIVAQYKKLGIMDLFDLTRSCEGDANIYPKVFGDLDYKTYVPGSPVPTCGKCFWCKERQWAFQEAVLSDIGKE